MALSRQDIARAGLRLLNEVGLAGLTLRLIAQELGVKAPALYWHLKNKQELLDEMATQMYRDAAPDLRKIDEDLGWAELLPARTRVLRKLMLSYTDGAKVFSGTFFTDPTLPNEDMTYELVEAGFDPGKAERALFTLYSYVVGFTIEEQAVYPAPGKRDERYPETLLADPDGDFEDGMTIVLIGIREWLAG